MFIALMILYQTINSWQLNSPAMRERYLIKYVGPDGTTEVCLRLQASDGVTIVSFSQHDGKGLVVLPASRQVDVSVQEVTAYVMHVCR